MLNFSDKAAYSVTTSDDNIDEN